MLEDRQHNALAALDIFQNVVRADSLSGDVAKWQRAFDEAKRANDPRKPPPAPTPRRADAAPVACTFILVDGSVDQVIQHTGAWQSIVAREVRDLKKMDCGKVTTKEYANETIGYTKHDSVRKDASERCVTAAEAQSLNAARAGAAWSTGEGETKKWWTNAARNDAIAAEYIVTYLDGKKVEQSAQVRATSEDDAETKVRRHAGVMWGDIISVKRA